MTVLITGGSGYFGSHLLRRLREAGSRCRVFDVNDAEDRPGDVEFVAGDIRDQAAIRGACDGVDVVHHNVAQVPLARDASLFESVNVEGTRRLLDACADAGVRKIVYTSSSAIFGVPESNPVTEETPPVPGEAYGRAKLAGEKLCRESRSNGLDVTIIRPRTILGHGRLGIFQTLFEWIHKGQNIPVLGAGDNVYQFAHADDLARACMAAGEREGPAVYNIGAETYGTMRSALEALVAHAGTKSRVRSVPMWLAVAAMKATTALGLSPLGPYHALMYGRSLYFDISAAKRDLQWSPRFGNDEMLAESYDWYGRHRDDILAGRLYGSKHRSAVEEGALALLKYVL